MYSRASQAMIDESPVLTTSTLSPEGVRVGLKRKALRGKSIEVKAIYEADSLGHKKGRTFETVLVREIRDAESNELLADHLWFRKGKELSKASPGDQIRFAARPIPYQKGYLGNCQILKRKDPPYLDYKLTPPRKLVVINT